MRVKHTNPAVITTIKWTEDEKDIFIAALGEVINDYACIGKMPEEVEELFITFLEEF